MGQLISVLAKNAAHGELGSIPPVLALVSLETAAALVLRPPRVAATSWSSSDAVEATASLERFRASVAVPVIVLIASFRVLIGCEVGRSKEC